MSNDNHAIQDLHDILHSYYRVARKRLIDCIRIQAADYLVITEPHTPLKSFSPAFMEEMTPAQLGEVSEGNLTYAAPLAFQVGNSPLMLLFNSYLTQRSNANDVQTVLRESLTEASQHQQGEPLQNRVYRWIHHVDLYIRPAPQVGGPLLTWSMMVIARNRIRQFEEKYRQGPIGVRTNFEILWKTGGLR
ncbi:MAG: hypothetical protein Q9191_005281 [Dirinaria sp. TL-2023a]